jgi:crotonobetainyl-CoA:carnitine CoA-transferase CaiB-like acyl-CoA transferase
MSQALADILVLDLSGTVSTTYCAKLFADYGATVVNLEPEDGFPTRKLPPHIAGAASSSAMHAYLNANKQSVQRDQLSKEELSRLISQADLVLSDGGAQELTDAGLSMSITWYGEDGPYADFVGTDAQCFALNGMLRTIGHVDGPPLIPTGYQAQIVGGTTAFIGAMGQVLARELNPSSVPLHLHTSIFEAMLCFTEVGAITAYNTGLEGHRLGINRFPPTYPLGVFPCRDGWIGLTVLTPSQWHAFCELLDMPEFSAVDLFQSSVGRLEAVDLIEPIICEKLLNFSAEDLFYRAQNAAVPLARVPTMEELFQVDQFVQRNAFAAVDIGNGKSLQAPTIPFRLFMTPPGLGGAVAALGADTQGYKS